MKKRRTKKDKLKLQQVGQKKHKTGKKVTNKANGLDLGKSRFLGSDLTKVAIVSMLAIGLEIFIWRLFFN